MDDYRSGNTILLDRVGLIAHLRELETDPQVERERCRKKRLAEEITKIEKHRRAAAVHIHVESEAAQCTVADLPAGVSVLPGRLTIQYDGVEELLSRLYELAQAAANDFDRFSASAGGFKEAPRQHPG